MQSSSLTHERDGFSEKENTKQRKNLFLFEPLIIWKDIIIHESLNLFPG